MSATLALMLALAPCYSERNDPARVEHVTLLAQAIDAVTEKPEERAALITIAKFESSFCWSVATGRRHGGDGWGPWQLEHGSHRTGPYFGATLPELTHAAGEALWLWRHSWQCGPSLESRFKAYAGLRCLGSWRGARPRANFYYFASNKLHVLAQVAKD